MLNLNEQLIRLEEEAQACLAAADKSKGKPAAKEDVLRLAAAVNRLTADILRLEHKS